MKKINVFDLPLAFNVCDQMLREVEKTPNWSMAHVVMNPRAASLPHYHEKMEEIYVITRGTGQLLIDTGRLGGECLLTVQAGDMERIGKYEIHALTNISLGSLHHLVFSLPPFKPRDVHLEVGYETEAEPESLALPKLEKSFVDGAKIVSKKFGNKLSIAFGWLSAEASEHNELHHHERSTEWIYVAEGNGLIQVNGRSHKITRGDWIRIEPGEAHALRNFYDQALVVVCVYSPAFDGNDVHYNK